MNINGNRFATHARAFCASLTLTALVSCETSNQDHKQAEEAPWQTYSDASAQAYIETCKDAYSQSEQIYADLESDESNAKTLLTQMNDLSILIDGALGKASLYANVHPNEQLREAAEHCDQRFVSLSTDISLSQTIYQKVAALNLDDFDALEQRLITDTRLAFTRSGVALDEENRKRVKLLNEEINELGQEFYKNTRDDVRELNVSVNDDLSGLPEDFINSHLNDDKTALTLTTNYPDYFPVMQYANNDELRKSLYKLFRARGYPKNEPVLNAILQKRHELATLLGYEHYAHYVTETQMIESADKAQEFIDAISKTAKSKADEEYQELLSKLQEIDPSATSVGDWQKTYISEKLKQEKFSIDSQKIREYFQYSRVKTGIFQLTEELFNVEIRPWNTEVWHDSVEAFELVQGDVVLGQFYLDMHPRDNKYNHAAAFTIQDGITGRQLPIKALVCNFPSGENLMEHGQVETFLHEFGHLLHGIFAGDQQWSAFSGIKTERDFVEAPSQLLEQWAWNKESLALFAKNMDGEAIPDTLISQMNAARRFGDGLFTRHQMFYAAVSLNYYNRDPSKFETTQLLRELQSEYSNFSYVDDTYFQYSFGHLFGYSAVYYTYMWSLVIADDMFSEFQKQGMMNPELAQHYRKTVLDPGGSKDASELVKDFLGREYNFDAFSKRFN
jgi:thimet oligopeptidase